jgi:hypothetical protein
MTEILNMALMLIVVLAGFWFYKKGIEMGGIDKLIAKKQLNIVEMMIYITNIIQALDTSYVMAGADSVDFSLNITKNIVLTALETVLSLVAASALGDVFSGINKAMEKKDGKLLAKPAFSLVYAGTFFAGALLVSYFAFIARLLSVQEANADGFQFQAVVNVVNWPIISTLVKDAPLSMTHPDLYNTVNGVAVAATDTIKVTQQISLTIPKKPYGTLILSAADFVALAINFMSFFLIPVSGAFDYWLASNKPAAAPNP